MATGVIALELGGLKGSPELIPFGAGRRIAAAVDTRRLKALKASSHGAYQSTHVLFYFEGGSVPKFSLRRTSKPGFAGLMARVGLMGSLLSFGCLVSGCSQSEPQVASDVPEFKPAPSVDSSARRPKGMPKNTTAGLQIDPTTGRPLTR